SILLWAECFLEFYSLRTIARVKVFKRDVFSVFRNAVQVGHDKVGPYLVGQITLQFGETPGILVTIRLAGVDLCSQARQRGMALTVEGIVVDERVIVGVCRGDGVCQYFFYLTGFDE